MVYGLLAEVCTVLTIIAIVMIHRYVLQRGLTTSDYAAFSERVGGIVGIIGGTLYTYLFAQLIMRRLDAGYLAHGIIVVLAAVALSVGGSLAGHHGVPAGYLIATALKIAAGALSGYLAGKSASTLPA